MPEREWGKTEERVRSVLTRDIDSIAAPVFDALIELAKTIDAQAALAAVEAPDTTNS